MKSLNQSMANLRVRDIMTRGVESIPRQMSLPAAARLLWRRGASAAPITDSGGRCVGVLCARDFVRLFTEGAAVLTGKAAEGTCAWSDWQIEPLQSEQDPEALHYLDLDPATISSQASLTEVVQLMLDTHRHSVIVLDEDDRPLGMVTSLDILAALARAGQTDEVVGLPVRSGPVRSRHARKALIPTPFGS